MIVCRRNVALRPGWQTTLKSATQLSRSYPSPWAPAGVSPRVGNEGVWRTKVLSRVQGQLPGGGLGAKPPEAEDIFSRWYINTSFTKVLDIICSKITLFNLFRPPCPCLRAPMHFIQTTYSKTPYSTHELDQGNHNCI